eukprot:3442955-Amphidinium_carterae.1
MLRKADEPVPEREPVVPNQEVVTFTVCIYALHEMLRKADELVPEREPVDPNQEVGGFVNIGPVTFAVCTYPLH